MKMILPLQPPLIGGFPARHVAMFDSLVFEWSFYLDSPRNGIDPNSWPLKKQQLGIHWCWDKHFVEEFGLGKKQTVHCKPGKSEMMNRIVFMLGCELPILLHGK